MSWASFHVVEVMSSPKLLHKRTGYLAAAQSFQQDTDVLMLTTNLIKKVLRFLLVISFSKLTLWYWYRTWRLRLL